MCECNSENTVSTVTDQDTTNDIGKIRFKDSIYNVIFILNDMKLILLIMAKGTIYNDKGDTTTLTTSPIISIRRLSNKNFIIIKTCNSTYKVFVNKSISDDYIDQLINDLNYIYNDCIIADRETCNRTNDLDDRFIYRSIKRYNDRDLENDKTLPYPKKIMKCKCRVCHVCNMYFNEKNLNNGHNEVTMNNDLDKVKNYHYIWKNGLGYCICEECIENDNIFNTLKKYCTVLS